MLWAEEMRRGLEHRSVILMNGQQGVRGARGLSTKEQGRRSWNHRIS